MGVWGWRVSSEGELGINHAHMKGMFACLRFTLHREALESTFQKKMNGNFQTTDLLVNSG